MTHLPPRPSVRAWVIAAFVCLLVLLTAVGAHGATRGQGSVFCKVSGPQWRKSADANAIVGTSYTVRITMKSLDVKLKYSCAQARAALKKVFALYPRLRYPEAFGKAPTRLRGGPAGFVCNTGTKRPTLQDSGGECVRLVFGTEGAAGNVGGVVFAWGAFGPQSRF